MALRAHGLTCAVRKGAVGIGFEEIPTVTRTAARGYLYHHGPTKQRLATFVELLHRSRPLRVLGVASLQRAYKKWIHVCTNATEVWPFRLMKTRLGGEIHIALRKQEIVKRRPCGWHKRGLRRGVAFDFGIDDGAPILPGAILRIRGHARGREQMHRYHGGKSVPGPEEKCHGTSWFTGILAGVSNDLPLLAMTWRYHS